MDVLKWLVARAHRSHSPGKPVAPRRQQDSQLKKKHIR